LLPAGHCKGRQLCHLGNLGDAGRRATLEHTAGLLLDSGTGRFGTLDPRSGAFEEIAFCPGYLRGLAFHREYAIVGVSQPLKMEGIAHELYDVVALPGVRRPQAIGLKTDEIRRILTIED
jgi:hypothetical protein